MEIDKKLMNYAYSHEQKLTEPKNGSHDGKPKFVASVQAKPWLNPS